MSLLANNDKIQQSINAPVAGYAKTWSKLASFLTFLKTLINVARYYATLNYVSSNKIDNQS